MWTYSLILLISWLPVFLASFYRKFNYKTIYRPLFIAITVTAFCFVIWDIIFTAQGVWGFSSEYLIGSKIVNLPLEEVLFFLVIPYCCFFTYYLLRKSKLINEARAQFFKIILLLFLFPTFFTAIFATHSYTATVCGINILLFSFAIWKQTPRFKVLLVSYFFNLIPFTIVNHFLTTGISTISKNPIVWYNSSQFSGLRFFNIPFEDFLYMWAMLMLVHLILEWQIMRKKLRI